ncbi:hypothetical protein M8542_40760 [Amycolatopsis sp. OK19-0408]|uniref:Uncharacterized protein n=1 Tax=Amycolatopsis iheyensis TaxID=2945988 RepID=A0A9X2SNT4_9PSEU|nr:hypothetical protein [Amycolatopsis iheyensis]MCR6489174.1 hypothetical protein [Amycolatopsis iheyensis]
MSALEEALHALMTRGFRFQHIADEHGELAIIVGTYGWPGFADRIEIHGEHEASAARTRTDPVEEPVWRRDGDTLSVIAALLALSPPRRDAGVSAARRGPRPAASTTKPASWPAR